MEQLLKLFSLVLLFCSLCDCFVIREQKEYQKKGSNSCPQPYSNCNLGKDGYINVHLVPHTHDDVGWLKTVDQYYYGTNSSQQDASVQYILDTVVDELNKDPARRFVYVEIAYFWRWWNEQNDDTKQVVRQLVNESRLEFVIGAWSMNDEATTYYRDIIDQQSLGLNFILSEFGECARPRAAWQIDPFGHSREQASLFAQFGFDGLFLGRVDYQDFENRGNSKTREMIWQASQSLDAKQSQLFTGVLPNGYSPPPGFCFDAYCGDDPIVDNQNSDEYNVDQKVNDFIQYTLNQRTQYKTNNLIMTMGSDFQYSNAHKWFKNLDKLIYHVNKRQETNSSKINIFYSTTACYLYSLYKENTTWPVKSDDFFPYAHRPHAFWTGYYTSRPALKYFVRRAGDLLRLFKFYVSYTSSNNQTQIDAVRSFERAMGIAQHHDAVSGTERQHVANDYAKQLSKSVNEAQAILTDIFSSGGPYSPTQSSFCLNLNISECQAIENQPAYALFVANFLPQRVTKWLELPVSDNDTYVVIDFIGQQSWLPEVVPINDQIKRVPERNSSAINNLVFRLDLEPFSSRYLTVAKQDQFYPNYDDDENDEVEIVNNNAEISIKNNHLQLTFDNSGNLIRLDNLDTGLSTPINQVYCYYKSMEGNNSDSQFQASGAYVFRPQTDSPTCLNVRSFSIYQGKQFQEINQIYNDWISQTIRLYDDATNAEFRWQIGPIDVSDNIGKEVVTKFVNTNIQSASTFYTDSNGREVLKRVRDFRPTWNLNQTEKVSGNYYPINSFIYIRDEQSSSSSQLTLVSDRSQGASSIEDGSIEIMLHRRLLHDDALGVSEPLNETGIDQNGLVVRGALNLIYSSSSSSASLFRPLALSVNFNPLNVFLTGFNFNYYTNDYDFKLKKFRRSYFDNLRDEPPFPLNLNILSFSPDYNDINKTNSSIIRIEHFYGADEDPVLSQPATVNLQQAFSQFQFNIQLKNIEELALGANIKVEDLDQRLKWNQESNQQLNNNNEKPLNLQNNDDPFTFTFQPMQIRTFRIWYTIPNYNF